jgi:aerobic carbon-monoxide dehydrogenase large subunit
LPRYEDRRLLMGLGQYTDDIRPPGCAHACVVRSPHAAARSVRIDVGAARGEPGVLAVLTGADALADGIGAITTPIERKRRGGPMPRPIFPMLALDAVHFAGDAVALVIAETTAAQDAADRVEVEYDALPAVTSPERGVIRLARRVEPSQRSTEIAAAPYR